MGKKRFAMASVYSTQLGHMLPARSLLSRFIDPVARYTRFVRSVRGILWSMIVLVIALIIYIASSNSSDDKTRLVFSSVKKTGALENVMTNPHYQGLDAKNQPYSVMADEAIQQDTKTVLLKNIRADMDGKDNKWLALQAGEGELKIDQKTLMLSHGVEMFYDGGYEFRTPHAFIDIDKGSAKGDAAIEGQGAFGTLQANSFEVLERGKIIRFNGSVRMKVYRE